MLGHAFDARALLPGFALKYFAIKVGIGGDQVPFGADFHKSLKLEPLDLGFPRLSAATRRVTEDLAVLFAHIENRSGQQSVTTRWLVLDPQLPLLALKGLVRLQGFGVEADDRREGLAVADIGCDTVIEQIGQAHA